MSRETEALDLALRTRSGLFDETSTLSSILRRCFTICELLNREHENEWIRNELFGYGGRTFEEIKRIAPYRKVKLILTSMFGRRIDLTGEFAFVHDYFVGKSIPEIEKLSEGLYVVGGPTFLNIKRIRPDLLRAHVSDLEIQRIIEFVRNRSLEFLNEVILELKYGGIVSTVFEEVKAKVDSTLVRLCPSAIEKLNVVYERLTETSSPEEWSQVAHTCRRILKDVADVLYPPSGEPYRGPDGKFHSVKDSDIINRLCAYVDQKLRAGTPRRFTLKHVEYVGNFLRELQSFASKGEHAGFTRDEANRCVIHTYLILGDIVTIDR